jgi:hypothetical protein
VERQRDQNSRVEYAWDSIVRKPQRSYPGSTAQHPENNLSDIFGVDDRKNGLPGRAAQLTRRRQQLRGFAISYSGSLMDNVRSLGANNQLVTAAAGGTATARRATGWTASGQPAPGSGRLHLSSLARRGPAEGGAAEGNPDLQAGLQGVEHGHPNLSDHSKGFFPTEMAFSRP